MKTEAEDKHKRPKTDGWSALAGFIIALAMTSVGVWMIAEDKVGAGLNWLTMQPTGTGGELLIFVGIMLFVVAYLSLSPFGRIRSFFERKRNRK